MVTFKCKASGNFVTFKDEVDIVSMRQHTEYEEVKPVEAKVEVEAPKPLKKFKVSTKKESE